MRINSSPHMVLFAVLSLPLLGCTTASESDSLSQGQPSPVVTVPSASELNLPGPEAARCGCDSDEALSDNYFDRGVRALAARDYGQAMAYFQRHRREESDQAQRESDIGIAFVKLMSNQSDALTNPGVEGVDERAEVMILALAAVQSLEGRIEALNSLNSVLSQDLKKREEALKRLRDLTLGQQESAP